MRQVFPHTGNCLRDRILIIFDGDRAGLADQAADRLNAALRVHKESVLTVAKPGGGDFFEHDGLLYLSLGETKKVTHQLVASSRC